MNGIIKRRIWGLTLFAILLTGSLESYAARLHNTPDSLVYSLYFRLGDDLLMKDYRDNQQTLLAMATAFTAENAARILKINIIGSASPEGGAESNDQLALRRAKAVRGYIIWRWGFTNRQVIEINTNTDYLSAWVRAVESDPALPRRDKVLEILYSDASIQTKWANIQLFEGDASSYMEQFVFPRLRNVVACVITFKESKQAPEDVVRHKITQATAEGEEIISADESHQVENKQLSTDNQVATKVSKSKVSGTDYRFAIKTNLLQGAVAFAPNLGFEYALSNKSTIELTGALNHWGLNGSATNNKKLAHWIIQSEYRYWLKSSFNGHFFGVHALGGKYNISGHTLPNLFLGENLMESQYRYDGWTIGGGMSYGYHLRFARHWGVEFNIGIGVAHLRYDKYDCVRCGRKLNTETKTYFGPTKAGISLIYNF